MVLRPRLGVKSHSSPECGLGSYQARSANRPVAWTRKATTIPIAGFEAVLRDAFAGRAVWPPAVRAGLLRAARRVTSARGLATGSFAALVELALRSKTLRTGARSTATVST
jgi:hypothetical protein